jgi:hypothetical protein
MKFSIIFLFAIASTAFSSDLIDIIKNTQSTYDERSLVSSQLASILGLNQPLPTADAIAEICYQVDICAQLSSDTEVGSACDPIEYGDDFPPFFGGACYLKDFREAYRCSSDIPMMSHAGLVSFSELMRDTSGYYSTVIKKYIYDYYKKNYNVDLTVNENVEPFFESYPDQKIRILDVAKNALALGSYTGNCYSKLNQILYTNDKAKQTRYFNLFKSIVDTLDFFPSFSGKVNRGVMLPKSVLAEHHKIGNIVCYDGFTSTSVHDDSDYTNKPRNYFLREKCTQRIYITQGKTLSTSVGRLIDGGSLSPNENEVLFKPGTCFRVDKVSPRDDIVDDEQDHGDCGDGERFNFELSIVPNPNF